MPGAGAGFALRTVAAGWHWRGGERVKVQSARRQQLRLGAAANTMRRVTGAEEEPPVSIPADFAFRFRFHPFQQSRLRAALPVSSQQLLLRQILDDALNLIAHCFRDAAVTLSFVGEAPRSNVTLKPMPNLPSSSAESCASR